MFQRIEINSPSLTEIGQRFQRVAEFYSVFFRPIAPKEGYPDFMRGMAAVLMDVLQSDFLRTTVPHLFPLNLDDTRKFTHLDRFEFEGSLISLLLKGTCTEKIVATESESRELVRALLAETILRPDDFLVVYRMDGEDWSERARRATISATYFVYAPHDKTWWFLGFADDY